MNIGQWIHFSIDDVISCFKWIFQNEPESIFEEPMLAKLKQWHEEYNIDCDLYVYEITEGFCLAQLQEKYWNELAKESAWLKLGWHRRKAGFLTDDVETEIASFDRVYSLITQKASRQTWTKILRLHRWECSEELLEYMKQKKCLKGLLTADSERLSYDLKEEDLVKLNQDGFLHKNDIFYYVTDIRFDYFSDGKTVEEFLRQTRNCMENKSEKEKIELFCHEWKWDDILLEIEKYWKYFSKIEYPLLFEAVVQIDEWMYFTTINTNYLYRRQIGTEKVELVKKIDFSVKNRGKVVSLHHSDGKIWIIPYLERYIYIYSIEKDDIQIMPSVVSGGYKQCIQNDNELWLLPRISKCLVKINIDYLQVSIYKDWPQRVSFSHSMQTSFHRMRQYGEWIYLLKNESTHNVRVNKKDGRIEIWDVETYGCDGIVISESKVILIQSNFKKIPDSILLMEKEQLELFSDEVWDREYKGKKHLNVIKAYENSTFFLPIRANAIVKKDNCTNKVQVIDFSKRIPNCYNKQKYFTACDVFYYNERYILPGYSDTLSVVMDKTGTILEIQKCLVKIDLVEERGEENYGMEQVGKRIKDLVKNVGVYPYPLSNWKVIEYNKSEKSLNGTIGTTIYNVITKERDKN